MTTEQVGGGQGHFVNSMGGRPPKNAMLGGVPLKKLRFCRGVVRQVDVRHPSITFQMEEPLLPW